MITKELIFALIGGLGFFFFGMQLMSDGLKNIAGQKLKSILHMATKVPVVGVLIGSAITALIQSSSATTVMVVGFVNAGLLVLKQAICVIMGANIGTTFTAWLVSSMSVFKITNYALPAIGVGFAIKTLGKTRKMRFWGQVLLGFGLLFLGLFFMKDAFAPLAESQQVKDIFLKFGSNPILGVLVGMLVTMLIQSSSATIAIVQVMAFNGIIGFPAAVTLMLGGDIGTTITAQLAAIGTNLSARRAAMFHTLFNVVGVGIIIIPVYTGLFGRVVEFIVPGEMTVVNIMVYIAVANSLFKIINTAVFLPFIGFFEKASIFLVRKRKGAIELGAQYLEKHLLDTPPIALEQARKETVYMLKLARRSVTTAVTGFIEDNPSVLKSIPPCEQAIDNLQSEITQYLVELSEKDLAHEDTEKLPVLIHSVNDIERIGDHAENIVELAERKIENKLPFTDKAKEGIDIIWREINDMMLQAESALNTGDPKVAEKVLEIEERINHLQQELKKGHVDRLNCGECNIRSGVVFMDFVDNLEKIGDHLTNIAEGVISHMRWQGSKEAVLKE